MAALSVSIIGTPKTNDFLPWAWDSTRGTWSCSGSSSCYGPIGCGLTLPTITMTNNGGVSLTFAHRYSFEGFNESDGTPYDGGQIRLSVNGGPYATVPAANFSTNGYLSPIMGNINTNISNTAGWVNMAWVGESTNYSTGYYLTSIASLGFFKAGDTISIQFLTSWDDCSEGNEPNWEIDSIQLNVGAAVPATASLVVGAQSTYKSQPNPFLSYFWQANTGSGFTDIAGANSPTCGLNLWPIDSGTTYRCIVYSPGAASTSTVATASVTLPLNIAVTGTSSLRVYWPLPPSPLTATTYVLEKANSLSAPTWTTVATNTYQTTSTKVYVPVTVSPGDPPTYYRLRR